MLAVYQHNGDLHSREHRNINRSNARIQDQDPIHPALFKRMDYFQLTIWIGIGVSQNYRVTLRICGVFRATYYRRNERVLDSGGNHANRIRPACGEASADSTDSEVRL